ncbi:hypothetical protein M426DRAFT_67473 [Hypoxylon sp. CI-4A]|nr:hypothetical protein M426DRAFT_67473 [Hypoxylon sp. CI-4A]
MGTGVPLGGAECMYPSSVQVISVIENPRTYLDTNEDLEACLALSYYAQMRLLWNLVTLLMSLAFNNQLPGVNAQVMFLHNTPGIVDTNIPRKKSRLEYYGQYSGRLSGVSNI